MSGRLKKIFIFLIFAALAVFLLSLGKVYDWHELEFGVTFSKKQAVDLGLDWPAVYLGILDELGVKKIRLSAYWNEIEKTPGVYDWHDLDWQVRLAGEKGADVILAVGGRLPRWPECHWPDWAGDLSDKKREEEILDYIRATVMRYKDEKAISAWQVENEPFLSHFGECPELDAAFLDREIALVKSLDPRPAVVTDSGELSIWVPAARRADIFGTTMYRDTYSSHLKKYVHYPITPDFFKIKKNIVSFFASPAKWIVIELQGEPWCPVPFQYASEEERGRTMDAEKFKETIRFARETGFKEFYLWGAEWWYWEKARGNGAIWEIAKGLFGGSKSLLSQEK